MGYSNVAGDLNVYGISSLSDLIVRGGVTNYGSLVNYGLTTLGTATIANLTVTGNLIITATNTQTTNSLTINNAGTATALKVVQYEGGGGGHTHNVAEFWDFQTLAMVIDPEGNVGIHTTASPGYAFTALGGALMDNLTLNTPLSISSGGIGAATATTNYVFAGPSIGAPGTPSFRALVSADLPPSIIVSNIAGNGAALYSLTGSNVTGNVAQSDLALVVSQNAQPNITSVGVLTSLTVGGILNSNLFTGNASGISNITGSNVTGNVARSDLALVVSQNSQPNITSVGVLTSLTVGGILNSNLFTGNASGLSNITGSNVIGTVPVAQSVTTASQPNITSVGVLTSLTVGGILNSNLFTGNASGLSNITGSNVTGNVARSDLALVVSQNAQPNITSVGVLTSLTVGGVLNSNLFTGNASGLSNITGSNVIGIVPVAQSVTTASQPNITSVGVLTSLTVGGVLNSNLFTGNASGLSNISAANIVQPFPNIVSTNALTTTNVFTTNLTASGIQTIAGIQGLTSLNVTGNIFASNAITTTNVFAAGFTSNASNTNFFYSTLTVPFIYATTVNVFSSANVLTASVQGSAGLTSLNVTGNIVASNGFTTTNIFTTNVTASGIQTIAGLPGRTTLNVTGNIVASNGFTATNVFVTNVFASGQVSAAGRTGVGICTPVVYRQGAAGANWNTPFTNTSTIAITSGAVQMQCGANIMVATTQFIPFPVSYTGNPIVLVTSYGSHGNIWVSTITTTNFSVSANTAQQFEWLSIGI